MPRMTTVSTWRCKCGISIKVVTEMDRTKPAATQIAVCPNCGDGQEVYGDKILSITDDTDNTIRFH
jgi:hypothetical protein